MTLFTTVALSAAIMAVANAQTLIIGGGPAGVHMGYRLQERGESTEIWEMSDQLGGKAGMQYEKDGITMNVGSNFLPSAYREVFEVLEELDMLNLDELKIYENPTVVDPLVMCFLAMGFDETQCQDLTVYPEEVQVQFAEPMALLPNWVVFRGLLKMKEEDYFDTFVATTTAQGFDWTSPDIPALVGRLIGHMMAVEIPTYRQYMDTYSDGAFNDSANMDNDFNKYSLFKKSDEAKEALNQSALEFMQEKNIFVFRMLSVHFVTGLGYGLLKDIPLYYLGMMMIPQFVDYFTGIIGGNKDDVNFVGGLYILEGGIPKMLDNMVTTQNLDVTLNREVIKVVHVEEEDSSFFEVYYKENDNSNRKLAKKSKGKGDKKNGKDAKKGKKEPLKMERFDRVISGMSSQKFVTIYNKGEEIQQPCLCREECVWVSTVAEVNSSTSMASQFDNKKAVFEKSFLELEGSNVDGTVVFDPLTVKDAPQVNDDGSRRMQIYYQYPFKPVSNSKSQALNKQDVDALFYERYVGGLDVGELYSTVVVDNYHATSKDLLTCDPWDVHELQGKNELYFIDGTMNFDNLELLVRYNNYILDTHL